MFENFQEKRIVKEMPKTSSEDESACSLANSELKTNLKKKILKFFFKKKSYPFAEYEEVNKSLKEVLRATQTALK